MEAGQDSVNLRGGTTRGLVGKTQTLVENFGKDATYWSSRAHASGGLGLLPGDVQIDSNHGAH
jgi:hypothetical protein